MLDWLFGLFGYERRFNSAHSLLKHEAMRQQYESIFGGPPQPPFAGLGNPWRPTAGDYHTNSGESQESITYRHLAQPGYVSRDKSGNEWPLLRKFED